MPGFDFFYIFEHKMSLGGTKTLGKNVQGADVE
jgi:hypothetical protein